MKFIIYLFIAFSLIQFSCESTYTDNEKNYPDPDCKGEVVTELNQWEQANGFLNVTGSANHTDGLTIRRIIINGKPATNSGFNFDAFTITLQVDKLLENVPPEEIPENGIVRVELDVFAVDACNRKFPQKNQWVTVDTTEDGSNGADDDADDDIGGSYY